jgi:HSP20 family molecular chaperone IbpA
MPVDLFRDGDQYVLSADLPGIDPESVDLDVDGQLLTIRAERRGPSAEQVKWLTRERPWGDLSGRIGAVLPSLDDGEVEHFQRGLLVREVAAA